MVRQKNRRWDLRQTGAVTSTLDTLAAHSVPSPAWGACQQELRYADSIWHPRAHVSLPPDLDLQSAGSGSDSFCACLSPITVPGTE